MPSGDDWRTVNRLRVPAETEADTFSSALIQLVRSASNRGNRIQLSLHKLNGGQHEYIRTKVVEADGRIAGGRRAVDDVIKGLVVGLLLVAFVALLVLIFALNGHDRLQHKTIDGVECVVVNDGLGRPKMVDCNWGSHG